MVSFAAPYKRAAMKPKDLSYGFFKLSHQATPTRRSAIKCKTHSVSPPFNPSSSGAAFFTLSTNASNEPDSNAIGISSQIAHQTDASLSHVILIVYSDIFFLLSFVSKNTD